MKKFIPCLLLLILIITGCDYNPDTIDTPLYSGKSLIIGVIGKAPYIRERNVRFVPISFADFTRGKKLSSEFDAIIIMQDHLLEADNKEYAHTYKTAGLPFFFIETEKSYHPFTEEELTYEEVPDLHTDMYSIGYYQTEEHNVKFWGYGLYKNKVNSSNIKNAYSRMFTTIASIVKE